MRIYTLACITLLTLTGCASQIMSSYIDKDIREVMVDYGAPSNAFDMGDGRRAFQWVMDDSYTTPTQSSTTGSIQVAGNNAWVNSNTLITGGQTINSRCIYTMFARWNSVSQGWSVTDFRKPKFTCE